MYETPSKKLFKPQLEENLNYIKDSLISHGYPSIGDLFSNELEEVKKTIDCLYSLLSQRQKDLNFRSQIQDRLQKLESEKNMYQQKIELLTEDKNSSISELGKAQNKLVQENSKWKKEREKVISERDDLKKEITKFMSKESKFLHEIKKKEAAVEKLKEQLRKALGDKDLVYLNHIDLVEPFHNKKPKTGSSPDEEFKNFITEGYDDNQSLLMNEIQELRSALETIQKEIHLMMDERKEVLISNMKKVPHGKMIKLNSQIFQIPFQSVSEDIIETFIENIRRFKEFMRLSSEYF